MCAIVSGAGGNVLYFPHIDVSDTEFLKGALCIWESVYRIVPEGVKPNDSEEVRRAVDRGVLRNIQLSQADLTQARADFHEFLDSVPMVPDALEKQPIGTERIHYQKIDERMIAELSDLVGAFKRCGDWFELPRGLADGYMLFLSNAVARRRGLPKITDSETMFVAMSYFANDGDMDEKIVPVKPNEDVSVALLVRTLVPGGLSESSMERLLKFRDTNKDGRLAFRGALDRLSERLAKVEDESYALELIRAFGKELEESQKVTTARAREFFSGTEPILLYLGLPILAKAFDLTNTSVDSVRAVGTLGMAMIAALATLATSRRKEWVPQEATYLAKLRQEFSETSPIPKRIRRLDRMMNEFMND